MIRMLALFLALALPAAAQETIVAGMSQNRVSITADFDGSEIIVYGAVRRGAPPPPGRRWCRARFPAGARPAPNCGRR